jgi:type IV secretory pathway TrbD component
MALTSRFGWSLWLVALTGRFGWSLWLVALSWLIACGATVSSLIRDVRRNHSTHLPAASRSGTFNPLPP